MTNSKSTNQPTEQYLQLWVYLLPIVGVIPAIWTLYKIRQVSSTQSPEAQAKIINPWRQQQKASRIAINLVLIWLGSYALFSMGASHAPEIASFRLLYANAIITSSYFLACTFLLTRLSKNGISLGNKLN